MATVNAPQQLSPSSEEAASPGVILGTDTPRDIKEMIQIYERNVQAHGFSAQTLLYRSCELHDAKIKQCCHILLELIKEEQIRPGHSLLDIGCGYGSLFEGFGIALENTNYSVGQFRYRGIDLVPDFIQYACDKFNDNGLIFKNMDLVTYSDQEDWCILLGVVNSVPDPKELVHLSFSKCKKGFLVDFNNHKKSQTNFNKFDIDVQIEHLYRLGASCVEIRFDDSEYGWTILLARH